MALTKLQSERVAFHLGFVRGDYVLALDRDISLITLNPEQTLALVGPDLGSLDPADIFTFAGSDLCSNTSLLGQAERAYAKISVDIIEESLFVERANTVELRPNELKKRQALYRNLVNKMAQLVGSLDPMRVGW